MSPETNYTAPYATSSSRAGANVPITSSSAYPGASTSVTATTDYVRAASYTHQHHVQAANKSFSSNADEYFRTAEKFGLVDDVFTPAYFAGLESNSHSEESSGSSSSGAKRGVRSSLGVGAAGVGGKVSGGRNIGSQIASAVHDIDLDELEFYNLPSEKRPTTAASSGASPPHKTSRLPVRAGASTAPVTTSPSSKALYSWQDPDFGKA